jgi:putative ABC transport system permease protein
VLTIPFAGIITGRHLNFLQFADPLFWVILAGIFTAGVILSGLYPAFVLSSYKPIYVLKGKFSSSRKGQFLRKSLVVFQFAASVFLITGTAIVYHQLRFMMKQDLGININKTIVLHGPGVTDSLFNDSFKAFKTEILRNSYVQSLTSSTTVPGEEIFWTRSLKRLHGGPESRITIYNAGIDYDYIPAFNLSILSGRNFSPEFPSDVKALIMNRSMFNMLEFESMDKAINEQVVLGEDTFHIIGVIEDYHQMSLKNKKQPIVFRYIPAATNFFSIKTDPANTSDLIASIKNLWGNYFPGNPIEYFYLDQFFNKQYEKDQHFGQVFSSFSLLAIFIACLGLSGLASFTTIQRTKEIGIRKTMGSTVAGIVILLIKDFLKPIIIAIILSIPITWFTMENWLYNFPYRINIPWYFFVLSAGQIILLAVLTVSIQTVKSALNNPSLSLRYE